MENHDTGTKKRCGAGMPLVTRFSVFLSYSVFPSLFLLFSLPRFLSLSFYSCHSMRYSLTVTDCLCESEQARMCVYIWVSVCFRVCVCVRASVFFLSSSRIFNQQERRSVKSSARLAFLPVTRLGSAAQSEARAHWRSCYKRQAVQTVPLPHRRAARLWGQWHPSLVCSQRLSSTATH